MPEHCALETHCTQALFEQCGLAVGQSESPTHCTQPGVFVIPQSTRAPPPSAGTVASVVVVEPSPEEPPELDPLEEPLSEPLPEEPLEDPEPPSGLTALSSPPQPTPTATAAAMARPRHCFNEVMADLLSLGH